MEESRSKRSIINIIFSIISYFVKVVLVFYVRRVFIQFLSIEILGINGLFANIISILSIAELGIGSAISFAMYKPMADGDEKKVQGLLQLYRKYYRIISFIIFVIGLILVPFLKYFVGQGDLSITNIYLVYALFLANSIVSYCFAYRRILLLTNQRHDILSKVSIITIILLNICQVIVLKLFKNYYAYLTLFIAFSLIENLIILIITNIKYKRYISKARIDVDSVAKKNISKNIKGMMYHKVGAKFVYGTDNILISILLVNGLAVLGVYSNYTLIVASVVTIIGLILTALTGSIGNSIATKEEKQNLTIFNRLNFIYMWIVSFCTICLFSLSNAFIATFFDSSLVFNNQILLLVVVSFYIENSVQMVNTYNQCVGIFYEDRWCPLFQAVINLGVSILAGLLIGLKGIIWGTIISCLAMPFWVKPKVLFKHYFKNSSKSYWFKYFVYTIAMLIAGLVTYYICSLVPSGGLLLLLAKFGICAIVPNVVLLLCLFWVPEFKECIKWGKQILKNIFKSPQKSVAKADQNSNLLDGYISCENTNKNDNVDIQNKDKIETENAEQ